MRVVIAIFLGTAMGPALADAVPVAGLYRVEVLLEMPNIAGMVPYRTIERCLAADGVVGNFLEIVSSPTIALCPVVDRALGQGLLEVEIVCAPVNTGRARARFVLAEAAYRGRIAVTMGGKNMTLTEVQQAERIGDCR
jgi:hypothetical protein